MRSASNSFSPRHRVFEAVFDGGPPRGLERRLHPAPRGKREAWRRAFIAVLIGWVPLLVLAAIQDIFSRDGSFWYFVRDIGVHARFLIATPVLMAAVATSSPRLSEVPQYFFDSGIVKREEREELL